MWCRGHKQQQGFHIESTCSTLKDCSVKSLSSVVRWKLTQMKNTIYVYTSNKALYLSVHISDTYHNISLLVCLTSNNYVRLYYCMSLLYPDLYMLQYSTFYLLKLSYISRKCRKKTNIFVTSYTSSD